MAPTYPIIGVDAVNFNKRVKISYHTITSDRKLKM
jgi:hypothetical protein